MKHVTLFDTHSEYETYRDSEGYIKPNVSYCKDQFDVHYNYNDPRIIAKFNVTSTSYSTFIMYSSATSQFSEIEIDGVVQPSVVASYTFSTTGEHTIKYTLVDTTLIDYRAFYQCTKLKSVIIPDNITILNTSVFDGCSGLTGTLTLPKNLTKIGNGAFSSCQKLTGTLVVPNGVTYIGSYAFEGCTKLTSIDLPNTLTLIGQNAFDGCTGLTGTFIIPNSIIYISIYTFRDCTGLTNIVISNSIIEIGQWAFSGCTHLVSVTVLATTPPTLKGVSAFDNTNNCTIYVPTGSVDAYKAAANWSSLASRIQAIP